jgi:hypothetical protein
MFATGLFMISVLATANTALQTLAEEDKRGRVVAFYVLSLAGTISTGSVGKSLLHTEIVSIPTGQVVPSSPPSIKARSSPAAGPIAPSPHPHCLTCKMLLA